MTRDEYKVMSRKLYLVVKYLDGDEDISAADVEQAVEEDWQADSEGANELSESAFKKCFFQVSASLRT